MLPGSFEAEPSAKIASRRSKSEGVGARESGRPPERRQEMEGRWNYEQRENS